MFKLNPHPDDDDLAARGKAGAPLHDILVIDAHVHFGVVAGFPCKDGGPDELVAAMDRLGIRYAYVSNLAAVYGLDRTGNDELLAALRRHPARLRGYMTLNPGYPATILPEMERCHAAGLRAVKIWSYGNRPGLPYTHANYAIIFDFANTHGLPILAHTWGEEVDQLEPAFKKYGRINWILAHTGCRELEKYVRAANTYERVYLETCFSSCPRGLFERLVAAVPITKILWGSDQIAMNAAHQLGRVLFARIAPAQKRAILGENAARVLPSIAC
jgi:predicted TIM-barrel fold metal-dependent hydrolase